MFYLSRGEQIALGLLVLGLLAGGGLLTYERGVRAGQAARVAPLFVEAPARPAAPASARVSGAGARGTTALPAPPLRLTSPTRRATPAPPEQTGPISLNTATAEQLDSLPGIGPKLASRILEHRARLKRENGRGFTSVDELLDVSGIGPKRLAAVRERVVP